MKFSFLLTIFLVFSLTILKSQDNNSDENKVKSSLTGFIRAGFYGSMDRQDDKPYVSSSFGDFGIKADIENNKVRGYHVLFDTRKL